VAKLESYRKLAPFTIDELVDAANSALRSKPKLQVTKRTVRYYIAEGIVSHPQGAPKYARYSFEALLRLIGARCLLDQGQTLESSRKMLDGLIVKSVPEAVAAVESWLQPPLEESAPVPMAPPAPSMAPMAHLFQVRQPEPLRFEQRSVRRTKLAEGVVLETDERVDFSEALNLAEREIQRLKELSDST
jgi:DNA-binding transcriptional MerR regulator